MKRVWAVVQHRDGAIHRMSWEAIAAAQTLAAELGGKARAILLGHGVDRLAAEVAASDLEQVRRAESAALESYTPGGYVAALAPMIVAERPDFVLFPHTYQTVEYMARLAQASGAGLLPEAIGFEVADGAILWKRPILEGKMHCRVRVKGEGPVLVSIQSGAYAAESRRPGSAPVESVAVAVGPGDLGREILGLEQAAGGEVDLTKAEIIVAVGRGIGGADKLGPVEELARLLKADIGASRPVIDNGWLPRDRQIGSSGQTVAPKLYLALGISGAIQHLVGMKGSTIVAAVNKDAGAPIFKIANYGIVGDLHEVVPALIAALKELPR